MKGLGVEREIKRDVSKSPLGISSPCWCVILEVAGARDLVCMKNFRVIGSVQRTGTNEAHCAIRRSF